MDYTIITLAVLLGIVSIGWLTDHLKQKGVNLDKATAVADKALKAADVVSDAAAAVIPCPATAVMQKIVDAAQIAVGDAEQMNKTGKVPDDERKATAEDILKRALSFDGIAYEGDVAKLGDAAMEAAVLALPKTHTTAQPESGAVALNTNGAA